MPRVARRVFGYARVSSEEQARGSSLRDQQDSISAYAKSHGLKVTRFFVEAESAVHEKLEKREQIQALLREVSRGDLVVVDKVDRWSRDPEFTYRSVRELLAGGASVFFVAEQLDPATSEGDTALGFRILFAREEHKRIRERMVGTRRRLVEAGYYAFGQTPFGYKRRFPKGYSGADRINKNILEIDKKTAPIVRRIFISCASGLSISKIVERLQDHPDLIIPLRDKPYSGIRDLVVDTVHKRVYLGEVRNHRGEWVKAKHEPIIDHALFVKAQDALAARRYGGPRPSNAPAQTDDWILRDVAHCMHCGARMSAAYAGRNPDGSYQRIYYACSHRCKSKGTRANTGRHVPVRLIEQAFEPLVLARLAELRDLLGKEPAAQPKERATKGEAEQRARLERKRARYLEMYSDGVMTREVMMESVARVDAELMRLKAKKATSSPLANPEIRRSALRELAALERAWRKANPKSRRAIINQLAESVLLASDELPKPVWRSADELAQAAE